MLSEALGLGGSIDLLLDDGTKEEYPYVPFDNVWVQEEFSKYLELQAMASIRKLGRFMDPQEYEQYQQAITRDLSVGSYLSDGPVFRQALRTERNQKQYLLLMLRKGNSDRPRGAINMKLVDEMFEKVPDQCADALFGWAVDVDPSDEAEGEDDAESVDDILSGASAPKDQEPDLKT